LIFISNRHTLKNPYEDQSMRLFKYGSFIFLGSALLVLFQCCSEPRYAGPLSPEQTLQSFDLQDGFRIEIFAAEPHVVDPVDLTFDAFGNAYAVEMLDYPYKPAAGKTRSRIRYLEDTDGDGRVDHSIIFQDSLNEATSAMAWWDGLLVCAAPEILFLKDHDGDHIADSREVLFTGFFANNSEAQITNLQFNVDNWIYASNHGHPGNVRFLRRPDLPEVSVQGTDFRFRLDRGLFEPAAGSTQFGQAITEWGQRFGTQNTIHISQIVIPWRYLRPDSSGQAKAPVQNISDHDLEMFQLTPPPYWRAERTARRQKAYDEQNLDRVEHAEDHFTGCSGGTVYTGSLFPSVYHGSIFTGEVAGNLIHRDILVPGKGPLYVARRDSSEKHREFLASTDPWFRPANFVVAPDGSLMVVDFYRQHIETPLSIPEDLKKDMDFYKGDDKGRIYRIVPVDYQPAGSTGKYPGEMTTPELVELLAHSDQWWRLTAQRLLLEKGDTAIAPRLRQLVLDHQLPLARLHALFTMAGLQQLDQELVSTALSDTHPEIRAWAIQLAENFVPLLPTLIGMADDPSVKVRFQLALSLGVLRGAGIDQALNKLLLQNLDDPWFQRALERPDKTYR